MRGELPTASPQALRDNALRRSIAQPVGGARLLCERMTAGEARSTGSVAAGGTLQELTTVATEPQNVPQKSPQKSSQKSSQKAPKALPKP